MKKPTKSKWSAVGAGLLVTSMLAPMAHGQSSEALMDALVRKGILTEQEAEDIKADVSKENKQFNKWIFNKDGLEYKIYGDVRGRYEMFRTENESMTDGSFVPPNKPRDRFRYRLRTGITATLMDQFEVGFRLTSSEAQGTFGGDPISGNTTMQDNGSKKFVYIDLAYGKWTPLTNQVGTSGYFLSGTIGKMENPFLVSDMVFDADYTPEGAALQAGYIFNDMHSLKLNSGYFVLDEINQGAANSNDPFMYGFQLRWDGNWITDPAKFPKVQTTLGAAWLALADEENLGNGAVPNVNVGNTRTTAGNLGPNYGAIVVDAGVTVSLEKFPMYPGNFPIRIGGEVINNINADEDNLGWWGGVFLGRASKKRSWELSYRYKRLESDAWFEEFVDSDFGAYYGAAHPNSGLGTGYRAGTGLKGHVVKVGYALSDSVTIGATWFYAHLINEPAASALPNPAAESESGQHRVQLDMVWKF